MTTTSLTDKPAPFLRWAGSKRVQAPLLLDYWKSRRFFRFIEPFLGSGSFFFAAQPPDARLNDINRDLVATFNAVRDHPDQVFSIYSDFPASGPFYYELRGHSATTGDSDPWLAARFIFLNRFAFNGLYRTNLKGQFNVPFSASRNGHLPSLQALRSSAAALLSASLSSQDFQRFVEVTVSPGDLVYLDPPFFRSESRSFLYHPESFNGGDLARLSACLELIHDRGAHFLLSYDDSVDHRLFESWHLISFDVRRRIAANAKHRRINRELLVSNFVPGIQRD